MDATTRKDLPTRSAYRATLAISIALGLGILILVNFIDRLGGSLLFPFFALYLTRRFGIGMTQVGILFAVFAISGFIGSFPGGALTDRFGRKKIIIFSRDELKQHEMKVHGYDHPSLRYFIGDVRDRERLVRAMHGVDIVVHAAALKQVPACEYNPMEAIKTNIMGTANVVEAALDAGVKKVMTISTDKAVNPASVMGATKRVAELIVQDRALRSTTRFSTVRFGNVLGSAGSVIPKFRQQIAQGGPVTVTHAEIMRFFMSIPEAAQLVLQAGAAIRLRSRRCCSTAAATSIPSASRPPSWCILACKPCWRGGMCTTWYRPCTITRRCRTCTRQRRWMG